MVVGEGVDSMCDGAGSSHSERFAQSELVLVLCVGVMVWVLCVVGDVGVGGVQDDTGSAQVELRYLF